MGTSRAEDTLAVDIYRRAAESGEEITLGTVERRLSELLAHEPDCCGLCTAAASVRPQGGPMGCPPRYLSAQSSQTRPVFGGRLTVRARLPR